MNRKITSYLLVFLTMAEGEGFEPPVPCGTSVFKTDALNHSATPPDASGRKDSVSRAARQSKRVSLGMVAQLETGLNFDPWRRPTRSSAWGARLYAWQRVGIAHAVAPAASDVRK